jgi:hypothetical protein
MEAIRQCGAVISQLAECNEVVGDDCVIEVIILQQSEVRGRPVKDVIKERSSYENRCDVSRGAAEGW